jgi:hypothetical protein
MDNGVQRYVNIRSKSIPTFNPLRETWTRPDSYLME